MGGNVPDIKIGTSLNELWNSVKNLETLSKEQKNSIFQLLKDEEKMGADKKISNTVELSMIKSWLEFSNKNAEVKMPASFDVTKGNVEIENYSNKDLSETTLTLEVTDNVTITDTSRKSKDETIREYVFEYNNTEGKTKIEDRLYDEDNDGTADWRYKAYTKGKTAIELWDVDLDGEFDSKDVEKDGKSVSYFRDDDNKWKLD